MNAKKLSLVTALSASLVAGGYFAAVDLGGAVAGVDVERAVREWQLAKEMLDRVAQDKARVDQRFAQMQQEAIRLRDEAAGLTRGTEAWFEANIKVQSTENELQMRSEAFAAQIQDKLNETKLEIYELLDKAIVQFATARKLQAVVRVRTPPSGDQAARGVRLRSWDQRDVLYLTPKLDVTAELVKFLKAWQPPKAAKPSKQK